jgi:hypothetical protein
MKRRSLAGRKGKHIGQRLHASMRCLERHGFYLEPHGHRAIIDAIQNNRATPIERQSNRITLFRVEYNGKYLRVAYDRVRKTLATVLPDD